MRLRLPELLEERGMTAYGLEAASKGRISMSAAYRLCRRRGKMRYLDTQILEVLCEVLEIEPGELLERTPRRRRK